MQSLDVYITQWNCFTRDYTIGTEFRAWGKTADNLRVCIHISSFKPWLYIEPDDNVAITFQRLFQREPWRMPVETRFVTMPKLYYANIDENGQRVTSNMAQCFFSTNTDFRYIKGVFERRQCLVHESNVPPLLQFMTACQLKSVGWHGFTGFVRPSERQETLADIEIDCLFSSCRVAEGPQIQFSIWSFDIEVYSSVPKRMPRADVPLDQIIQISLVSASEKILLYCGPQLPSGIHCATETDLLIAFGAKIKQIKPDFLLGYNILGFDFRYMIDRCKLNKCFKVMQLAGYHKSEKPEVVSIKWSSSAYRNQEFTFVPFEGIVFIDLLPIIRRDYKLNSYKLDAVVKNFLGADQGKDDMPPAKIFAAWDAKDVTALAAVGKYCIHDSQLVLDLFDRLQILPALIEMADVCSVALFDILVRGQQLKVFSQIYKFCYRKMVIDRDSEKTEEGYAGARVFDPKPGIYENVVSFDFNSLYPSTIISSNICFSTCVPPGVSPDPSKCYTFEWEDHIGCMHDPKIIRKLELAQLKGQFRREREELARYKPKYVMCTKRKFSFYKTIEGVIPVIIKSLLDKRAQAKKQMKVAQGLEYSVLNARQLALKISANSMYGFFGVSVGYLPFMPAAMTITYLGRQNVLKAADLITRLYGGELVYGDTDSVYATFPGRADLWQWAKYVAESVSDEFPAPLNLEFENAIYQKFLLLTKKRYVYRSCDENGAVEPVLGKKGVLLVRRDNCLFSKVVYEFMIESIFANATFADCCWHLRRLLLQMIGGDFSLENFVISKMVGDCNDGVVSAELQNGKFKVGDYTVSADMSETKMSKLKVDNQKDLILASLPPHIQLANRIRSRGGLVENGSRLEYVVTDIAEWNCKLGAKIEDVAFFRGNSWWLRLDYIYYTHCLIASLDQLFWIVFNRDLVMTKMFKTVVAHHKTMHQLSSRFRPRVVFCNTSSNDSGVNVLS